MTSAEIIVPATAFAIGEAGDTLPGEGEAVEFTGRGTVRIEGGKAFVIATELNGQPVEQAHAPASLDDEETAMRADAERADADTKTIY